MAFTLNITSVDGSGWSGAPSGMSAIFDQAASDCMAALIPQVANVNLTITRQFLPGSLGQSSPGRDTTGYSQIRTCYLTNLTPSNSIQAANWTSANIPSTPPTTELNTFMQGTDNLSIAIGRVAPFATGGNLTLNSGAPWDTSSLRGDSLGGSGFVAYGVIMHEITEFLGRGANADGGGGTQPMDNFVFSAAGTHCTTKATTRYISVGGGGVTPVLYNMNTGSGDAGDAASGSPSFNANASPQVICSRSSSLPLLATDWQWLTMLGWNLSPIGAIWAGLASGATAGGFSLAAIGAHGK